MTMQHQDDYTDEFEDECADDVTVFEPEPALEEMQINDSEQNDFAVKMLKQVHESVGHVIEMLEGREVSIDAGKLAHLVTSKKAFAMKAEEVSGVRVLEGVFDGQGMIGPEGKVYTIPPNYASKSRLVEGDILKLTIKADGTFLYKQIGPIERDRIVGELAFDGDLNEYILLYNDKSYRVLAASVTYFKGEPGDEAIAFIPKSRSCAWAAVENIIKRA